MVWLFAVIEVWSRLWPGFRVGRRSYRNTAALFSDVVSRGRLAGWPLITADGFEYYFSVIRRLLGNACVFGQSSRNGGRTEWYALTAGWR